MNQSSPQIVVAGHICLDIIPTFEHQISTLNDIFNPGKLVKVGSAVISTGGAVSNTGIALNRLGVPTRLVGKIGNDAFGKTILDVLDHFDVQLAKGMIIDDHVNTSYTLVINPPGIDRMFLHHPGANDLFYANDVPDDYFEQSCIFHFGYPPIMRSIYLNSGQELEILFQRVKHKGLITSLDMASPDPNSEAGKIDWIAFLKRVLPQVDVFLPSVDEILFMVDRDLYLKFEEVKRSSGSESFLSSDLLNKLASRLLDWGAAVVVLKLGDQGLYLKTTSDKKRLESIGRCISSQFNNWINRELLAPCFKVEVVGTTGSGDCTIAGFLTGLLNNMNPEDVIKGAVGVGAFSVTRADAFSGVIEWIKVNEKIHSNWQQLPVMINLNNWRKDDNLGLWIGPYDAKFKSS